MVCDILKRYYLVEPLASLIYFSWTNLENDNELTIVIP